VFGEADDGIPRIQRPRIQAQHVLHPRGEHFVARTDGACGAILESPPRGDFVSRGTAGAGAAKTNFSPTLTRSATIETR